MSPNPIAISRDVCIIEALANHWAVQSLVRHRRSGGSRDAATTCPVHFMHRRLAMHIYRSGEPQSSRSPAVYLLIGDVSCFAPISVFGLRSVYFPAARVSDYVRRGNRRGDSFLLWWIVSAEMLSLYPVTVYDFSVFSWNGSGTFLWSQSNGQFCDEARDKSAREYVPHVLGNVCKKWLTWEMNIDIAIGFKTIWLNITHANASVTISTETSRYRQKTLR